MNPAWVNPSLISCDRDGAVTTTATDVAGSKSGRKYFWREATTSALVTAWYFSRSSTLKFCETPLKA